MKAREVYYRYSKESIQRFLREKGWRMVGFRIPCKYEMYINSYLLQASEAIGEHAFPRIIIERTHA